MARDFLRYLALAQRALCKHVAMRTNEYVALAEQQEALRPEPYVRSRVPREDDPIADRELDRHEVPVVQDAPSPYGYDGPLFRYFFRRIGDNHTPIRLPLRNIGNYYDPITEWFEQ